MVTLLRRLVPILGHRAFGATRDAAFVAMATATVLVVSDGYPTWEVPALTIINVLVVLACGLSTDLYDTSHPRVVAPPLQRMVRTLVWVILAYLTVHFVTDGTPERRTIVFLWGCAVAAFAAEYAIRAATLVWFQRRGMLRERVLIVGGDEQALMVAVQIGHEHRLAVEAVGILDEFAPRSSRIGGMSVLGDPLEVERVVAETRATAIVVVANAISWEANEHVMQVAADRPDLRVFVVAGVSDLLSSEVVAARDGMPPLVRLRPAQLKRSDSILKGVVDVVGSLLLLPVLLVVLVVAWLSWRGPLFRKVSILGRSGGTIEMRLLAYGPPGSLRSRLAGGRAGKLPALPGVLVGRLSLVGPRPLPATVPTEVAPWRRRLLLMAPGLTGPWDRDGSPSDGLLDDLTYIRTYTPWSDIRLLVASVGRLMTRQTGVPALREVALGAEVPSGAVEATLDPRTSR